jgi:dTDP-4-amino-4,6-dideoxygalactose transaminase
MDPILEIAKKHGLVVVEDACQAHGSTYKGKRIGSMGDATAFSFYPSKNLGACGDAGMVVTDDEEIASYVRMFRNVGQAEKYYHSIKGHNHRIDNLQAAILGVKLPHLEGWNNQRRKNADQLNRLLAGSSVVVPSVPDYCEPVWHLYVIRVQNRDDFMEFLKNKNIGVGIHYPIPIHLQEAYQDLGYNEGDFPVTEEYAKEIVSLPMFPEMTGEQIEYLVDSIKEFTG